MKWAEPLPESCPPRDAKHPDGKTIYRIIDGISPSPRDFYSQRKLNPSRSFRLNDECLARAVSVYDEIRACKMVLKLPAFRRGVKNIVGLALNSHSGMIKKTGREHHYSWWVAEGFDPIKICSLISE